MNAPIVIFAYNRLAPFQRLIQSLKNCPEHSASKLFIFIDGPKNNSDRLVISQIREYAESIEGFESLYVELSSINRGLGASIIRGVSKIINKYNQVIVLEDDLVLHPMFLKYMNDGLSYYENNNEVFSICGYTNKIIIPRDYNYNTYFCTRSSSWGWGTWKNRWNSVDWKLTDWDKYIKYKSKFNRWGGSDCFKMLNGWKYGHNHSWAIRFCFNQFLQDKVSLFPIKSLVANTGFDGTGTNCKKWSRFKYEMMDQNNSEFDFPSDIIIDKYILEQSLSYHSILRRLYSRLMYLIYK
ncbi:MAG: glycosyltransferase [Lachnoclostridium sp.]|nr:glycosyltransferase [Lachnoclostridium sp.]